MVDNEIKFANILKEIKSTAILQGGVISKEEVDDMLAELELSKDQLSMVYDYLRENKISLDGKQGELPFDENDSDILDEYLKEVDNLNTLNDGELRAYTISAMNGDNDAKAKLLDNYLPRVIEISKLYASQGVLIEDLIGEGNLALAEGVNMLGALEEPEEAEAMLIKLVMNAMEELISEAYDEKSKDEKVASKVNEVSDAAMNLSKEYGRKVTVDELAEESGISKKKILDAIKLSANGIEDIEYFNETT